VTAQCHVEISMSGDALDGMRWCLELKWQADHRVAEATKPYIG
jgi:hypothetical protein